MQVDSSAVPPDSSTARTAASHTSRDSLKDWSLPDELVQELSNIKNETIAQVLDRYLIRIKINASNDPFKSQPEPPTSAFITALLREPDTKTDKGAAAYSTSDDPLVDLFWELGPAATPDTLNPLLERAWRQNPLDTLKIIWQARSIHEGKGIREAVFFHLIGFLYRNHPRTLMRNLHLLVDKECSRPDLAVKVDDGVEALVEREGASHGYYKDLLNILLMAVSGALEKDVTSTDVTEALQPGVNPKQCSSGNQGRSLRHQKPKKPHSSVESQSWNDTFGMADKSEKLVLLRERLFKKLSERKFRAMYLIVCKLFSQSLQDDLNVLEELKDVSLEQRYAIASKFTLASKWAPTPGKSHDKQLSMASAISAVLFPEQAGIVEQRVRFQTKVLAPLRQTLDIPEVKMAANEWKKIKYARCASKCMSRNKVQFFLHDEAGFTKYINEVTIGKRKISGAALFPHELLLDAIQIQADLQAKMPMDKLTPIQVQGLTEVVSKVIDSQWQTLVETIKESGTNDFTNCIAVVDVSGSMGYLYQKMDKNNPLPIAVSVALGIMTAQLASPPYNGAFITFSEWPEILRIPLDASLSEIAGCILPTAFGLTTAFDKTFDLLLDIAVKNSLSREEMVKKLFVFSDMQFDAACAGQATWNETIHQGMVKKFAEAGYALPEIVYWNLQGDGGSTGTLPARADQPGVQLLSGYSASLMKTFMRRPETLDAKDNDFDKIDGFEEGEKSTTDTTKKDITSSEKLAQILANEAFSKLKVYD